MSKLNHESYQDNNYQFVVRTYNQEKLIVDLLNSIRYQVITFGKNLRTILTIIDDMSEDSTVQSIENWIKDNASIFYDIDLVINKVNMGIDFTHFQMFELVKHRKFVLIDGDDLIYLNNIYKYIDFGHNSVFSFSPVLTLNNEKIQPMISFIRVLLIRNLVHNKKFNRAYSKIKAQNLLTNPGSLLNFDVVKDINFKKNILSQGANQIDHSIWLFLLKNNLEYTLYDEPVIIYRPSLSHPNNNSPLANLLLLFLRTISSIELFNGISMEFYPKFFNPVVIDFHEYLNRLKV
jgi:hypothetical protein